MRDELSQDLMGMIDCSTSINNPEIQSPVRLRPRRKGGTVNKQYEDIISNF